MWPKSVVYSFVVGDLFHYGHLQLLQAAKKFGELHVCGVLTDEAAISYRSRPIANFEERSSVISCLRCVDQVVPQSMLDPTENLQKLHATYPHAQFILVHGNDWKEVPGREFIEKIKGRIVQPNYYRRLAESRIKQKTYSKHLLEFENFTEHFRIADVQYFTRGDRKFVISTKANTLSCLQPLLKFSRIEQAFVFRVYDWQADPDQMLNRLQEKFSGVIVVRSSAVNEDSFHASLAGYYTSVLNVEVSSRGQIREAVRQVIGSYSQNDRDYPFQQILVQTQTRDIHISGVVFTHMLESGAPYYIINYDNHTGLSNTVTGGHEARLIQVFRNCPLQSWPLEWRGLRKAIQEIELIIPGIPLDIEFAITSQGTVVIFQVRPLQCDSFPVTDDLLEKVDPILIRGRQKIKSLLGVNSSKSKGSTILSDMAFWNPAELIGARPRPLALSLFKKLITDRSWNAALVPLGYFRHQDSRLLVEVAGKPYIDVRKAFEALIPTQVSNGLRTKLVKKYLDVLRNHPELHDKVEFEVVDSAINFGLNSRENLMSQWGISSKEIRQLVSALRGVTNFIFKGYQSILKEDFEKLHFLQKELVIPSHLTLPDRLRKINHLVNRVGRYGAVPFSRIARMAFIGKAFLKSFVDKGVCLEKDLSEFLDGLETVSSEFRHDCFLVSEGNKPIQEFLEQYGHLRPGMFDINALRYDQAPDLIGSLMAGRKDFQVEMRRISDKPHFSNLALQREIRHAKLSLSSQELITFIKTVIKARELAKFEFSKMVSAILEHIAGLGTLLDFSRDAMSFLTLNDFREIQGLGEHKIRKFWSKRIMYRRKIFEDSNFVMLPPVISASSNISFMEHPVSRPNFVTKNIVQGPVQWLSPGDIGNVQLVKEKIVIIENADPGYDWIFSTNIRGLITCYGGVASHMAIRCAELNVPAAIGCGHSLFSRLPLSGEIRLNCEIGQVLILSPNASFSSL